MSFRILLVVVSLSAGCDDITWERMLTQRRVDLYEPTTLFADGSSMRLPPAGTVPRGEEGPAMVRQGYDGDLFAAEIPVPQTLATLAEGRRRFAIHCAACHGPAGDGQSVVATFMTLKRPASLVAPPVAEYPPGRIFQRISEGYRYMRSYQELGVEDRWAVVQYVIWLRSPRSAPRGATP